jgi:Zn-dependent alcohol dehydrogenase
MWATVRKARPLLDEFITHVMPLEDVSAAMDLQDAGECGKILLLPHGEFDDVAA